MKLRPFELSLIVVFIILAIGALILLSTYKKGAEDPEKGTIFIGEVQIWGTLPEEPITLYLSELSTVNKLLAGISYRYISAEDFDAKLTEALADGTGPDMILTSQEHLVEQRKRIQPISYDSFPLRDLQTNYLDGAGILGLSDGIYGYPFFVDPLMMFWNKDILTNAGFLNPPTTWEELINVQFEKLIEREDDRSISRSVVALGEYDNVRNAFGIISALLLQSGTAGIVESNGEYNVQLENPVTGESQPLRNSLDFYLRFNKPSNALYSWNRSFAEDRTQFISEELVFYFGFGSEGRVIERLNPNLNFDIAEMPQGAAADVKRTYAHIYSLAPLRSADNLPGSFGVISTLGTGESITKLSALYNMAPALRTLAAAGSNDTYGRYSYKSAAVGFGWLNPQIAESNSVFKRVTSDISDNRRSLEAGVIDVANGLEVLYR